MLFYLDRQTISVLKTTLKGDLGWTDIDYGRLVVWFMLCYTISYLFTGSWIDRWGTRRTMTVFLVLMSVSMLFASRSTTLMRMGASMAILGLAEAGVMPAIMVAIFAWFPPDRRGMATTIKEPIFVLGQVFAAPIVVGVTSVWNWHAAFIVPGAIGIAVAVAWWLADRSPGKPGVSTEKTTPSVSYLDVLRHREIWGVIFARLVSDPLWFFLLYWQPGFLRERLGFSMNQLAWAEPIPVVAATTTLILLGFLSDRFVVKLGWAPARSRRVILQSAAFLAPVLLLLNVMENKALAIVLLCIVRIMAVVWLNFTNILMADLVPQRLIGRSIAVMSAFGASTSLLCTHFTGPVVTRVGYGPIFAIGACLHPIAALILWRFYRKMPPVTPAGTGVASLA